MRTSVENLCKLSSTVLAAWMRIKYPHIAIGALASSAPILQFEYLVPPETFYNIVSNDFKVYCICFSCSICFGNVWCHMTFVLSIFCSVKVSAALILLNSLGVNWNRWVRKRMDFLNWLKHFAFAGNEGIFWQQELSWLLNIVLTILFFFHRGLNKTEDLADWLESAYSYLAMVDYPLPSEFMMPLPGYPIKEVSLCIK